jgi:transposase-like protein
MLTIEEVAAVRRGLEQGVSQRELAKRTGVARSTVARIASGARRDRSGPEDEPTESEATGPVERCPECGGRVVVPCRGCAVALRVEDELARRRFRRTWTDPRQWLDSPWPAFLRTWQEPGEQRRAA